MNVSGAIAGSLLLRVKHEHDEQDLRDRRNMKVEVSEL